MRSTAGPEPPNAHAEHAEPNDLSFLDIENAEQRVEVSP
jgi:hypothetical protein